MTYRIEAIAMQGFRGAFEALTIPFAPSFNVITGRNGTGKSTLIDSIEFAFTGTLSRFQDSTEKKETIDDYLWWRGGTRATKNFVDLQLTNDVGNAIQVFRSSDRSLAELPRELFDSTIGTGDAAALFASTSIIRDETITRFSVDLSESERFQFVRTALGLSDWSSFESALKDRLAEAQAMSKRRIDAYDSKRLRINDLTSQLSAARAQASQAGSVTLEALTSQYRELTGDSISSILDLMAGLQEHITKRQKELSALRDLLGVLNQIADLDSLDQEASARIKQLTEQLGAYNAQNESLAAELAAINRRVEAMHNDAPQKSALAELAKYGSELGLQNGHCPLCDSAVSSNRFAKRLEEIGKAVSETTRSLDVLLTQRDHLRQKSVALEAQIQSVTLSKVQEQERIRSAETLRGDAASRAAKLQLDPSADRVTTAINAAETFVKELESLRVAVRSSEALDQIAALEGALRNEEAQQSDLAKSRADAKRLEFLAQTAYDTARSTTTEIIDERLSSLEPLLLELYGRLKPHAEWSELGYRRRGHVRGMLSFTVGNELNPRFLYSSGQRRALGLAFLLSVYLARDWTTYHSLVLDDPIQHIDDYRALHLVETLASISKLGHQIVCAVEDSAIADLLCRRLVASSARPGLRIELEYEPGTGIRVAESRRIYRSEHRVLRTA